MKHLPVKFKKQKFLFLFFLFSGELKCFKAFDPDEGNNGRIIYSFNHIENSLLKYLYLNNETGCLTIVQPLLLTSIDLISFIQLKNYLLITIRAQDLGSSMSSTLPSYHSVQLIIHDINDHKPIIQLRQIINKIQNLKNNSKINVKENTIAVLAIITIDDDDQGIYGQIQLTFTVQTSNKVHRKAFQIKSTSAKHYKVIFSLDIFKDKSNLFYLA
jgi:hypothetical protein